MRVGGWAEKVEVGDSHGAGPLSHNYPAKAVMWVREGKRSLQGASEAWAAIYGRQQAGRGGRASQSLYVHHDDPPPGIPRARALIP